MPAEFMRYKICRDMGWDYHTYMRQPMFFLREILEFAEIESEYRNIRQSDGG